MDHTKTKTFIAFINVSGKDKWWIDGNCTFEVDRPSLLPYDTKEQKETAISVGKTKGLWDETTDVYGIVLKVQDAPFRIISREEADIQLKELAEKEAARKAELGITGSEPSSKKKKRKTKNLESTTDSKSESKVTPNVVEVVNEKQQVSLDLGDTPKKKRRLIIEE
jgi:hypothetical protein